MTEPKALKFMVEGVKGKARPRVTRSGHAFTPKETTMYENFVRLVYREGNGERLEGAVKAVIHVFYEIPQSYTKKRRMAIFEGLELPIKKPDVDNIAKIVLDSLNGIAFRDDSQVTDLVVRKFWTEGVERVEFELTQDTREVKSESS